MRLPDTEWWYYKHVPEQGMDTSIAFEGGMVIDVQTRTLEPPGPASARHGWARELIIRHLDRVVKDQPGLMTGVAYREMTSPPVLDFVLNADAYPSPDGQITCRTQQFGQVGVLVTLLDLVEPARIRELMPGGYMPQLDRLLRASAIRLGEVDVAHWILCRDHDGRSVVHLAYVPASQGITALMPWDLLSAEEQGRGFKTS
ncbi:hypothetical protein CLM62_02335 [Streptomyces sp. SA15]|uniref:hypothetical protein n=1 Tax=Streptomyces sp. SA15 TaxID=934019 RepID=UPI000BAEA923|nr:hypothetical protein [Streptomyces sp. SA15]PAZ17575.1 hypothetical protein CLM62_02335 [Streptomyces sp. SA15]